MGLAVKVFAKYWCICPAWSCRPDPFWPLAATPGRARLFDKLWPSEECDE